MEEKPVAKLQRTRKQTCLLVLREGKLTSGDNLQRFNELLRRVEREGTCVLAHGRRTRSEQCLGNHCRHYTTHDDQCVTEILMGDAEQIYFNDSDTKSEDLTF